MSNAVPANAPGLPARRGFLRGLVTLPLIGGGLTLIGQPTAAAVPVTDALHERYFTWLAHEHRAALRERTFRAALAHWTPNPANYEPTALAYAERMREQLGDFVGWVPHDPEIERLVGAAEPSTRAAGVPLTGGRA